MRKTMIFAFTAVAALAVTTAQPISALAAKRAYGTAGNCQNKIIMKEAHGLNVQELLGNLNLDCDVQGNKRPNVSFPDLSGRPERSNKPQRPGHTSRRRQVNKQELPEQPKNGGSQDGGANAQNSNANNQNGNGSHDAWTRQVVELVNTERAKAGLPALTVNNGASSAAQVRAKEIASAFSHTRPNGSSFSTALKEAGVSYSSAGENIAYGQKSPQEVMEQWMNSAGHRANILNPDYTAIGVGHYESAAGVNYWTQLFIR